MARRVRSRRRSLALIGAGLLAAAAVCSPVAAQDTADYGHLLDSYAAGHLNEAVTVLAHWPRENVKAAVRRMGLISQSGPGASARLRAAAMLHTDLAAAILTSDGDLSAFHLGVARDFVNLLAAKKEQVSGAHEFVKRWFEFAPTLYLVTLDAERASRLVREGLDHSPADPILYFYIGTIVELTGVLPTTMAARGRGLSQILRGERQLQAAADAYRRALAVDGHLAIVRLHLGRVRFQLHDSRARADFEVALADATDTPTRYLAHLFLGAIAEHEQRLGDALREYEEARSLGPQYQTGYIAVSRIAEALGDTERARQTASTFVGIEKREDPWWDFHLGGMNLAGLEWLRASAQGS
jgi:tetratricopeptide (TPR) repeat protein